MGHTIVAVGSRSADKAQQWVKDTWAEAKVEHEEGSVKTYGDYARVYADKVSAQARPAGASHPDTPADDLPPLLSPPLLPSCSPASPVPTLRQDVDAIYIGTPHSHHYQDVHKALSAGQFESHCCAHRLAPR